MMAGVMFDDVWEELKNEDAESKIVYETAEELSRIILELIEARIDRGYTQRDLAERCGLKQAAIARMESLKSVPRLDTVVKVAKALNVVISFDRVVMQFRGSEPYVASEVNVNNDFYKFPSFDVDKADYSIGDSEWNHSLIIS